MTTERVQLFLDALRESVEKLPRVDLSPGGYVDDADDGLGEGVTIDGWWTVEQLAYALDVAEGRTAPSSARVVRIAEPEEN